jgi:hypothetical protein
LSGAGTPVFHWRHTLRETWQTPWKGIDVTVSWRYFSPVKLEALSPNLNIGVPATQTIADPAQENRCREPGILIALNEVCGSQSLA